MWENICSNGKRKDYYIKSQRIWNYAAYWWNTLWISCLKTSASWQIHFTKCQIEQFSPKICTDFRLLAWLNAMQTFDYNCTHSFDVSKVFSSLSTKLYWIVEVSSFSLVLYCEHVNVDNLTPFLLLCKWC